MEGFRFEFDASNRILRLSFLGDLTDRLLLEVTNRHEQLGFVMGHFTSSLTTQRCPTFQSQVRRSGPSPHGTPL